MSHDVVTEGAEGRRLFVTTRWSLILASADAASDEEQSSKALAELCRTYWRPVFAFICRRGADVTDAQDLTQDFFLKVVKGDLLQRADPQYGRFRAFLLQSVKNFLSDARVKQCALKRGGGQQLLSWDQLAEESPSELRVDQRLLESWSAERVFDIRWAATVVEQAQWRLREECEQTGRRRVFDTIRPCLAADREDVSYAALAKQLRTEQAVVKRLVHQMRVRYRELLREQVAQTVDQPEEVDEELRYLCAALVAGTDQ